MYLPLEFYLPKPKVGVQDVLAPLGISFHTNVVSSFETESWEEEIAKLKAGLKTHPLIGVAALDSTVPVVPSDPQVIQGTVRRSVGGSRASDLASQFEEETSEYPSSVLETYLDNHDDDMLDLPPN